MRSSPHVDGPLLADLTQSTQPHRGSSPMFDVSDDSRTLQRAAVTAFLLAAGAFSVLIVWNETLRWPHSLRWSVWAYSEWLISYADGFVRRGLVGELLLRFYSDSLVSAINHGVFIVYATLVALFCLLIILRAEYNIARAAIAALIPGGLVQMAFTNEFYYRKEAIFHVYLVALGIVSIIMEGKPPRVRLTATYLFALMSLIMLFISETFIFITLPATILIMRRLLAGIRMREILTGILAVQFVLFAVLAVLKGSVETAQAIWDRVPLSDRLMMSPDSPNHASLAIDAIGLTLRQGVQLPIFVIMSGLAWLWALGACGLLLILWLFFGQSQLSKRALRLGYVDESFAYSVVIIFGGSLPLYFLGWDWGRWISASVISTIVVYYVCLHPALHAYSSGPKLGRFWGGLLFVSLVVGAFLVRLPECCISGSGQPAYSNVKALLLNH
jgi:hypothetical protein